MPLLGSLLAGFYLLRVYDVDIATFVAILINVLVAVLGLADRESDSVHTQGR